MACLSVAASTGPQSLERVFGSAAYVQLREAAELNPHVEGLFRTALRLASSTKRTTDRRKHRRKGSDDHASVTVPDLDLAL